MAIEAELPVEERLIHLLEHFGLPQVHLAGCRSEDWEGLVSRHPGRVASLTLVCPNAMDPTLLGPLASRLAVITGDQGPAVARIRESLAAIPDATSRILRDYIAQGWSDVIADRRDEIDATLGEHLQRIDRQRESAVVAIAEGAGDIAGLSYRVRGMGPALLLLPLGLAPSQWEPLLDSLSARYCTIALGGAALGMVAMLEKRGHSNYWQSVRGLIDVIDVRPGEAILEVGCGSGVILRRLARQTAGANRIVGVDISPYLLREARALARGEGFEASIAFREGNAEALPFPDNSFDITMACTVLEEGDADRMLAEMVRVTRPGGRVAVIVRTIDMPWWVNAPLRPELKVKVEAPSIHKGSGVATRGCADATIYRRCRAAGLTNLNLFPQFQTVTPAEPRLATFEQQLATMLSDGEAQEWWRALGQAKADGTFFMAMPLHCAVGTKP
jgi:SAM-dependent methyltransferase